MGLISKVVGSTINTYNILLTKDYLNEGTKIAQTPKNDTQEAKPFKGKTSNQELTGIRDEIASAGGNIPQGKPNPSDKRTRSQGSSRKAKPDSIRKSVDTKEILKEDLHIVIRKQLEAYKDENGKYNGIIRRIDAQFLRTCYYLTKSNPGIITAGVNRETLDGINEK